VEMPNEVLTTIILGNFTPFVQNSGDHYCQDLQSLLTQLITLARIETPRERNEKLLEIHQPGNSAPIERKLQFHQTLIKNAFPSHCSVWLSLA